MTCKICGLEKCRTKGGGNLGRTPITHLLGLRFSAVAFKLALSPQARAVLNEYSFCEQQRLIYLMKTEKPLFTT